MASSVETTPPLFFIRRARGQRLLLSPDAASRLGLADGSVTLTCGHRSATVDLRRTSEAPADTLLLPDSALHRLGLAAPAATRLRFRVKSGGHGLELGPVIGILAKVGPRRPPRARDHGYELINAVWNVQNLGGLVYFFAPQDVDWRRRTVKGFVHVPGAVEWEGGEFPFPKAVYRRAAVSRAVMEQLQRSMTPHVFNPVGLGNKLVQYELLLREPAVRQHLPETHSLDGPARFQQMLRRYGRVYVKNTHKGAGGGIFRVDAVPRGLRVRYRVRRSGLVAEAEAETVVPGFGPLMELAVRRAGRRWTARHWLVQRPVRVARYAGRPFDIRVDVQKDGRGRWVVPGHIVRIAPGADHAVTRLGRCRSLLPVAEKLWPGRAGDIIRQVDVLAVAACSALEKHLGLMGDVGVDIALDRQGKPWFLEANPRPNHIYRTVDRLEEEYWTKIFNPLVFAAHLAGFSLDQRDVARPKERPIHHVVRGARCYARPQR